MTEPASIREIIKKTYNCHTFGQVDRKISDSALSDFIHKDKYTFDMPNNNLTVRNSGSMSTNEILESMRFYGRPIQMADDAKLGTGGEYRKYYGARKEKPEANYQKTETAYRNMDELLFSNKNRALNGNKKLWTDGSGFLNTDDPEELATIYNKRIFRDYLKDGSPYNYYEKYLYFRGYSKNIGDETRGGAEFENQLHGYNMDAIYKKKIKPVPPTNQNNQIYQSNLSINQIYLSIKSIQFINKLYIINCFV